MIPFIAFQGLAVSTQQIYIILPYIITKRTFPSAVSNPSLFDFFDCRLSSLPIFGVGVVGVGLRFDGFAPYSVERAAIRR